jgi:hypothetical protein
MRGLCVVGLIILMSACSSHAVRCDGRLQPINAPAPVQRAASQASSKAAESAP